MVVAAAAFEPFSATIPCADCRYGAEKSTTFARSGLIDTWLMSKSKFFTPGAMAWSKLAFTQVTAVLAYPSFVATAYATALS